MKFGSFWLQDTRRLVSENKASLYADGEMHTGGNSWTELRRTVTNDTGLALKTR